MDRVDRRTAPIVESCMSDSSLIARLGEFAPETYRRPLMGDGRFNGPAGTRWSEGPGLLHDLVLLESRLVREKPHTREVFGISAEEYFEDREGSHLRRFGERYGPAGDRGG